MFFDNTLNLSKTLVFNKHCLPDTYGATQQLHEIFTRWVSSQIKEEDAEIKIILTDIEMFPTEILAVFPTESLVGFH